MLKRFLISYSIMFAFVNLSADLGEIIAPGNEWTGGTELGFYFVSVAFAFMNTFLWQDKKKKPLNRDQNVL